MSLHNGSSRMAHNLDRFDRANQVEQTAIDAARLGVSVNTVRRYHAWYGEEAVTVCTPTGLTAMPAFEFELRWQVLGEKVRAYQQLPLNLPATRNHYYARETRG